MKLKKLSKNNKYTYVSGKINILTNCFFVFKAVEELQAEHGWRWWHADWGHPPEQQEPLSNPC